MTLYDFLYIDQERVRSLYAQLFSGLLGAIENVASESTSKTTGGQIGGDPVGHLGRHYATEEMESRLERMDPHDLVLRDVLQGLADHDLISTDLNGLECGSLVLLHGDITILNFAIMRDFMDVLPDMVPAEGGDPALPKKARRHEAKKTRRETEYGLKVMRGISTMVPWTVQVVVEDGSGMTAWGAISADNLRDAPGNLALKHGPTLAGKWFMLAIVDVLPQDDAVDDLAEAAERAAKYPGTISGMIQAGYGIRNAFGRPQEHLGVTPLLIFRKLAGPPAH